MVRDVSRSTAIAGTTLCSFLVITEKLRANEMRSRKVPRRSKHIVSAFARPTLCWVTQYWIMTAARLAHNRVTISHNGIMGAAVKWFIKGAIKSVMLKGSAVFL